MTPDVFVRHYTAVADATQVPVLLYNVPAVTGVNLTADAVGRLAAHPNIIGVKETGSDTAQLAAFVAAVPDRFAVIAGSAPTFYPSLCVGATGGILATVSSGSVDDALACVDAASAAAKSWAQTAPRKRSEILQRTYQLMVDRVDELALLITAENGKALADAEGEVLYSAEFFRWYAEEAVRIRGDIQTAPGGTNKVIVLHQPVGIALLVTPWNFPAAMAARKIGPALAAGCTTILKPASETPLTALALAALMEEAGLPAGVVNVLPSRQSGKVVSAMLADPRVRKLSFTGSTEVGRVLLNQANEHIVNASMELGGNAPFVVFADADLDSAIQGAMIAKMRNGGEACTAANRFYVESGIAEAFSAGPLLSIAAALASRRLPRMLTPHRESSERVTFGRDCPPIGSPFGVLCTDYSGVVSGATIAPLER